MLTQVAYRANKRAIVSRFWRSSGVDPSSVLDATSASKDFAASASTSGIEANQAVQVESVVHMTGSLILRLLGALRVRTSTAGEFGGRNTCRPSIFVRRMRRTRQSS